MTDVKVVNSPVLPSSGVCGALGKLGGWMCVMTVNTVTVKPWEGLLVVAE